MVFEVISNTSLLNSIPSPTLVDSISKPTRSRRNRALSIIVWIYFLYKLDNQGCVSVKSFKFTEIQPTNNLWNHWNWNRTREKDIIVWGSTFWKIALIICICICTRLLRNNTCLIHVNYNCCSGLLKYVFISTYMLLNKMSKT